MKTTSFAKFLLYDVVVYILLAFAIIGMTFTIMQYSNFDTNVGFLQFKQGYLSDKVWLTAFYVHVFTSIFVLLAGATQFSNYILNHYKFLHKLIGKIYVIDILLINFPFAMIMAVYANGGLSSKIAFVLLDCLWFYFTLMAYLTVKKGDVKRHKQFMIRSYALTFSAITLRFWNFFFTHTTSIDVGTIYMIDSWMGFIPNLIIAELIIKYFPPCQKR